MRTRPTGSTSTPSTTGGNRPESSAQYRRTVLVIEDEPDVLDLVCGYLRAADFRVLSAGTAEDGLKIARQESPVLAILDLHLPGMSEIEFCKAIKRDSTTSEMRVIMLTGRVEEVDRIVGFEIGADDYVTKPFSPRELVYRVQSVLRRADPTVRKTVVTVGPITMDHEQCQVRVNGVPVHLTPKEFKMLSFLAEYPGVVQRRETLLCRVWGDEDAIDGRSVDTYLLRLRGKLGAAADCIETVYGFGYRLAV